MNDIGQTGDGVLFANTGTIGGNVTVGSPETAFWLEPFPVPADIDPAVVRDSSPSVLLRGAARIVPFFGREDELSQLTSWRESGDKLAVRLVFGPGGQGKTRLAAEFAGRSAADGWTVVEARHESDPRPTPPAVVEQDSREKGVLVVLDYAERWPRPHLRRLLEFHRLRGARKIRVLLLARPAGYWWKALANPLLKVGATVSHLRLGPLADTVARRRAAFVAARDRFAELMGVAGAGRLRPPGSLADDAYSLALTLHMAALATVDAHARETAGPDGPDRLSWFLLRREYDHWHTLFDNGRVSVPPETMARLVALATLTQSLSYADAEKLFVETGLVADRANATSVLNDYRLCYPAEAAWGRVVAPLRPDRLAEDFIAQTLPGEGSGPEDGDPWLAATLDQLLKSAAAAPYQPAVLSVLIEIAARWRGVRDDYLVPLLSEDPDLVLRAEGASLVRLAGYADLGLLKSLDAILSDRHAELDGGIAAMTRRLTDYALTQAPGPAAKAELTETLSARLSNAGLYDEALSSAQDAISIRRLLATESPEEHEPRLADSLGNAGIDLWHVGRLGEAVTAMAEAVDIYRRHAETDLDTYEEDLAAELTNLTGALIGMARYDEALSPAEEAVRRFRRLSVVKPGLDHELASALRNYSIVVSRLDRLDDALTAIEEAVAGYRRLVTAQPEMYEPELAEALDTLGNRLASAGRLPAALDAATESVTIFRRLALANPGAHQRSLALALNSLASRLWRLGEREASLEHSEEAVAVAQLLVGRNTAVKPALGMALNNLAQHLVEVGRKREALPVVDEAIDLWRALVADEPEAFGAKLERALSIRRHATPGT